MLLLKNQTADTDGTQTNKECSGGSLLIQTTGTFDGAVVTIQGRMHGFDFQDLRDEAGDVVSMTEPTTIVLGFCKSGFDVRAGLTIAGAGTDVSIGIL